MAHDADVLKAMMDAERSALWEQAKGALRAAAAYKGHNFKTTYTGRTAQDFKDAMNEADTFRQEVERWIEHVEFNGWQE